MDVPPLPKHLVLSSAHVTQPLNVSKGQADLYFEVDSDEGGYKYRLELMRRDTEFLHVFKGKKIWVAVD
ncbi:hypothetical protein, partial [Burkholderia sp. SIMBA_052]|uniref:hypothetical protein n=1 Tax=Burkholderia sp. SIMBA_052 TaxID=3085793 RepID=UPI00397C1450